MCTLTWAFTPAGYFVAFSRDERRARALGLGPRPLQRAGVAAIAPIDAEAGGTWLCVNELGLTLALLNGYRFLLGSQAEDESSARPSRGELAPALCDLAFADQLAPRLKQLDLQRYRPFELTAFDPTGGAVRAIWNGAQLAVEPLTPQDRPLVSSSFDDSGARRERAQLFARTVSAQPREQELEQFHKSHAPARGAFSPYMHREDAHTVSFTRVRVSESSVELLYQPQAPCAGAMIERAVLARRALESSAGSTL
jgi:hypothetical protein